MTEEWKMILRSDGYEVSSLGRVRSLDRFVKCGRGGESRRMIKGRVLKPHIVHSTGYEQVIVGSRRKESVPRLVALAFVDGHANGLVVNHKNGNRRDNRKDNLEWVTQGENIAHSYNSLGREGPFTGKTGALHPTSKPIVATNLETGISVIYQSGLEAAKNIGGLDSGAISRCCYGEYSSHKGYQFRFLTKDERSDAANRGIRR